jgi:hypothetical protein
MVYNLLRERDRSTFLLVLGFLVLSSLFYPSIYSLLDSLMIPLHWGCLLFRDLYLKYSTPCQVENLDCGHNYISLVRSQSHGIYCLYQQPIRSFFGGLIVFFENIGYRALRVFPCFPPYPINNLNKFYHLRVYPYVFLFFWCYSVCTFNRKVI